MINLLNKTLLATALIASLSMSACANSGAGSSISENVGPLTSTALAATGKASVHVIVDNIKDDQGYIMLALFNSADTFLGSGPLRGTRTKVKAGVASFELNDLPAGEYAISLFHDVDSDTKMAKNAFGIPTEPYGFSNNAPVRFGPPKWDAARFTVSTGTTMQTISLK